MIKNKKRRTAIFLLSLYMLFSSLSTVSYAESEKADSTSDYAIEALSEDVKVGSRFLDLFFGKDEKTAMLLPGGEVFGVKMKQKYVTVTESKRIPAIKRGDIIISINGKEVSNASEVAELVKKSGGESLTVKARHCGEEIKIEVRPTLEDGEYKLGLSLRDGALGIGTMTFVDPKTGAFGGLGHGICDGDSGEVISMENGEVTGVILGGIHRGECGKPGELTGILTNEDLGDLSTNSECGVFGVLDPEDIKNGTPVPIGTKDEVKEGEATIISTVKNGKRCEYKIEITDIDRTSEGSKSFRIKVTDPTLKALTGGIVRGMSGSPIIQDGKLVGAVTHVMVADPTEGYGIFIENMLNAANSEAIPKAA